MFVSKISAVAGHSFEKNNQIMQKTVLFILFFFGIHLSGFSQWVDKSILTNLTLSSVQFFNAEIGYVVGGNKIFKTTDGADTWQTCYASNDAIFFEDILVCSQQKVIAVGKNFTTEKSVVLKSEDAGNTWMVINFQNDALLKSLFFHALPNIYCSGASGTILKSSDSGNTWQTLVSGTSSDLKSIFFINEQVGFAVGGSPVNSIILKTINGGNTWNSISSPTDNYLQSVFFTHPEIGYVVGWNGEIIKTTDGGSTWISQNSVAMTGNLEVVFTDEQTGYIVGGQQNESLIQKTTNGGDLWVDISPSNMAGLVSICFPTFELGYAVGSNGTVLKTETGGEVSAVQQPAFFDSFEIFPNPVQDKLWIKAADNTSILRVQLYDNQGKLVQTFNNVETSAGLEFNGLAPNIYYIEIETPLRRSIRKIIKR